MFHFECLKVAVSLNNCLWYLEVNFVFDKFLVHYRLLLLSLKFHLSTCTFSIGKSSKDWFLFTLLPDLWVVTGDKMMFHMRCMRSFKGVCVLILMLTLPTSMIYCRFRRGLWIFCEIFTSNHRICLDHLWN